MSGDAGKLGGYGKPPIQQQFGPKRPGNRRGRPPGAKNTKTLVHSIAHERHIVTERGKTKSYTTAELLMVVLSQKAMKGDVRASRLMDKYRAVYQLERGETPGGFLVVPEQMKEKEWELHAKADQARRDYLDSLPGANLDFDGL